MLEKRWNEIVFFHICNKLLLLMNKDYERLFKLIDGLSSFGRYQPHIVKKCAYDITTSQQFRPTIREIEHLGEELKISSKFMFIITGLTRPTRYAHIQQDKAQSVEYFALPRFDKECYNSITRFTGSLIKFSELLFFTDYRKADYLGPLRFLTKLDTGTRKIFEEEETDNEYTKY